ncbi:hypothetical protein Fuma_05167 [Fuerstiella marisgermanici]|uniref:Uncharacterized protein n=1 Tax=Fuerstiella marisgermanici TaxID=1891926 RepID=A0A1P8WN79_9PLAN|nr:hypothetical protein Fuma_05167 [Fuerstiella marisgermanici]
MFRWLNTKGETGLWSRVVSDTILAVWTEVIARRSPTFTNSRASACSDNNCVHITSREGRKAGAEKEELPRLTPPKRFRNEATDRANSKMRNTVFPERQALLAENRVLA